MNVKRFLKAFNICLIMSLGILLTFSLSAQAYYGLGGIPSTQQLSSVYNTAFTSQSLNAYSYRDLTTMYNTTASTFTNPFATYGSTQANYADIFSQAGANTQSYSNIFGVNYSQGSGFYRDPYYMTSGSYMDYSSPFFQTSYNQGTAATPYGIAGSVSGSISAPWFTYGTAIDTVSGMGITASVLGAMPTSSYGYGIQHTAFGTPTGFNMAGLHPDAAGQLALHAFSSEAAAIDRMWSSQYMYTEQGMPFIPTASYYNPDSAGGSNWFFPSGDSSLQSTTTYSPVGTTSYTTGWQGVGGSSLWGGGFGGVGWTGTSGLSGWGSTGSTWGGGTGGWGGWTSAGGNTYGGGGYTYTGGGTI